MSKSIIPVPKSVALAILLCLTGFHSAKADSFTPSSSTSTMSVFNNVLVYYVSSSAVSNPWGLTNSAANLITTVQGNNGTQATSTETVTLTQNANGNFFDIQVGTSQTGSTFFTQFFGNSNPGNQGIPFTGTTANPNINPNSWSFNSSTDIECYVNTASSTTCNGPASDPLGVAVLQSPGGVDVFSLKDSSIEVAFTLTPGGTTSTPEPSSLLMLGSGLMGLMGLGLCRKGIV